MMNLPNLFIDVVQSLKKHLIDVMISCKYQIYDYFKINGYFD